MFIKQISDSFGGIRIDSSLIFAPGMTIKLLSVKLENKILLEKPEIFSQLGITKSSDIKSNSSCISKTCHDDIETLDNKPSDIDIAFEICISSNLKLIEGLNY